MRVLPSSIDKFLSLMKIHLNRAPCNARVIVLNYRPGEFWSAMKKQVSGEIERIQISLEQTGSLHRRLMVRQIAGLLARRIVCKICT